MDDARSNAKGRRMRRAKVSPIIDELAKRNRVRRSTVRAILDDLGDSLRRAILDRGESVRVIGLGTFYPKTTKAKQCRYPGADDMTLLPASLAVGFRAGNKAKKRGE